MSSFDREHDQEYRRDGTDPDLRGKLDGKMFIRGGPGRHLTKMSRAARSVCSLNRAREYKSLLRMLELDPGDTVLDVGSGDGYWTSRFAAHCGHITGVEPDEAMLSLARSIYGGDNVEYMRGFAESLPFPNGTFSKVVSISCLEHFKDPVAGLREMTRVLKPGGRIALSVDSLLADNSPASFRDWHRRRHYVTEYFNISTLLGMMRSAGIRSEPERTVHLFRSRLAARARHAFIRNPRSLLPVFPLLYGLVVIADGVTNEMHGQIVVATGTHVPTPFDKEAQCE